MSVFHLTSDEVLTVTEYACDDMRVAVRDAGLLESAAHRPSASAFGEEVYPDVFGKAGALLQALAINHPFVDGNKRTAWLSCVTFLALNGERLRPDIDAAEELVIAVATGELDDARLIGERLRLLRDTGGAHSGM
ncbi:type II toxin-antitoxin system death-on-curing family toxin [Streptomyces atacamensis]|uniref:type II toxin-antitoxin system death-on-curing family toxin n=1 Tax=Streptomyces atacamensis TaxID=531966 RepID=UPI00399D2A1D